MNSVRLTIQLIVISTLIISITDIVIYRVLKAHPERLTFPFILQVIGVTVVPLAINIWFHLRWPPA